MKEIASLPEGSTGILDIPETVTPSSEHFATPMDRINYMQGIEIPVTRRSQIYYNKGAQLFVKQAKFMEDFEDDFEEEKVPFDSIYPVYYEMEDEQLRCYFTWRTKARKGIITETSLSYVYLYIYELINNIGVTGCMDAMEKIVTIWQEYRKFDTMMDRDIVGWIKEYYISNEFEESFTSIIEKFGLQQYYPEILNKKENRLSFESLNRVSSHKIAEDSFLTEENMLLFEKCIDVIMHNHKLLFEAYGLDLYEIIIGKVEREPWWEPFETAVYHPVPQNNRRISISDQEYYECKKDRWYCYKSCVFQVVTMTLAGNILKRAQMQLNAALGYSYDPIQKTDPLLQIHSHAIPYLDVVIRDDDFNDIIDSAVRECYKKAQEGSNLEPSNKESPPHLRSAESKESPPHLRSAESKESPPHLRSAESIEIPVEQELAQLMETKVYSAIKKMRKVCYEDNFNSTNAKQFLGQAKILSKTKDDYDGPLNLEWNMTNMPVYSKMTNTQLRSYLTWRTIIRNGERPETTLEYIKLYLYELINNIGVDSPNDAVAKMVDIFRSYRSLTPVVESHIISHIKDYYLCNDFNCSFIELVKKNQMEQFYPYILLTEGGIDSMFLPCSQISSYKITKSLYYMDETAATIMECFNFVMKYILGYFKSMDLDLMEIIIGDTVPTGEWWEPFEHGVYYPDRKRPDKTVTLSEHEVYQCKNGKWECLKTPNINSAAPHILGYIMKRMESRLRDVSRFRFRLMPRIKSAEYWLTEGCINREQILEALLNPVFVRIIDRAAIEYIKGRKVKVFSSVKPMYTKSMYKKPIHERPVMYEKPVPVKIDTSQLEDIRRKARENQEKLTIATEEEEALEAAREVELLETKKQTDPAQDILEYSFDAFYEVLLVIQKQAIAIILSGEDVTKKLRRLIGKDKILPEVLLESINEQALLYTGDNIIETSDGEAHIYEEYLEDVQAMMRGTLS